MVRLVVVAGVPNKSSISFVGSGVFSATSANRLSNDKLSGADGCISDFLTVMGIISAEELASSLTLSFP